MAHDVPTLDATRRDRLGSRYTKRLRASGRLPAVIYGHGAAPAAVSLDERETLAALRHGSHVLNVRIDGAAETCLIKDLQFGFLGDNVIHLDLARVNLDEMVTVKVSLHFTGAPEAAKKAGNIVTHDLQELVISCKVRDIPEDVRIDLSVAMKGDTLTVGDLKLPAGVAAVTGADTIVCRVTQVTEVAAVGEAAAPAEGAAPEVAGEKKDAAAAAPTKDGKEKG
jgi:large subunit ribosomal protein L25